MKAAALRITKWATRVLVGFALLLALAAAVVWWWAGQEGSLQWLLQRIGQSAPLRSEGVEGSVRGGWHIGRIVWERDGLRLEAEDIRLEWQPLAVLHRTLQLEVVQVARARLIDTRARKDEPMQEPVQLRLPWRVAVESLKVGSFAYQGRTQVEGGGLEGRYAFDGLRHEVELASLRVAGGEYQGKATLLAVAPLTLDAQLTGRFDAPVPASSARVPLQLALRAHGPARAIEADAKLRVGGSQRDAAAGPRADAKARITPFAAMPVPRAEVDVRQLDLALFWPAAPRTQLSGHAEVVPLQKDAYRIAADALNAAAGPWDRGRLPVERLRAQGEWRSGTALLQSLDAQAGGGRVAGNGRWQGQGWTFDGKVEGVDPALLHTQLAALPLTGPLKLKGEGRAVDFDVDLRAGARRGRPAGDGVAAAVGALELRDLLAQGGWNGEVLSLAQLRLRTSDATLEGEGEWEPHAQAGRGRLQLRAPGMQVRADGSAAETRGQGSADVVASDLAQAQHWLARWPGMGDKLKTLALRGQAQVHLNWQGGWRDPSLQARASAKGVTWQPIATGDAAPAPWVVRDASLQWQGRLRDAALTLQAHAEQGQRRVAVDTTGRLGVTFASPVRWQGEFDSLSLQLQDPGITPGPWRMELRRAVAWRATGADFTLDAGEAVLHAPAMRSGASAADAVLAWGPLRHQRGQLSTTGRISGLPLAWVELFGGAQLAGSALSGDMVFDAQWDAQVGSTLRVDAGIARVRGDVNVLAETAEGSAARVSAGVRDARVSVHSQGDQLEFRMLWDSERAGHAEGLVRSRLVRSGDGWTWPEQAPLAGRVQAQLPRIGVWSLLAPPGWRLRGSLSADIQVAGTRADPSLSGPLAADDLALRSVVDGIELRNGRLRARLAGRSLVVDEFLLHGSPEAGSEGGTLLARGEGSWSPQGPVLRADAVLSQLRASVRSDRQLTVSGKVAARVDRAGTQVTGDLRVDRARIQIPDENPPRLAEDVVVRNAPGVPATEAERRQRPPAGTQGSKLDLRLAFDMGPDFRVTGRGVDTRLVGTVEIRATAAGTPEIVGLIRTAGGTYEAYGQRMNIERGELRFTGPADNPALDILAVRPNMVQKVGVQVTGRAQAPHVELYSDPALSEAETLSWIVLGRSSAGGGAETAMLQRAAAALLAGRRGTGKSLASSLGVDDISVAPDGTNTAVVRVGKRFADNFYAAYERSLAGAMGTLFLFYDVSKRVTVRAEAGERTGLDLIFTFSFDKVGGK
jgi:translocation and assembly module TamB